MIVTVVGLKDHRVDDCIKAGGKLVRYTPHWNDVQFENHTVYCVGSNVIITNTEHDIEVKLSVSEFSAIDIR